MFWPANGKRQGGFEDRTAICSNLNDHVAAVVHQIKVSRHTTQSTGGLHLGGANVT
nr:hypothetical protein [Bradyrhizobium sp. CCBAU 53340]